MNFHNFLPIESTFQVDVDRSICVGGGGEGTTGDEGGGGRERCIILQRQQFELGRQHSVISHKVVIDLPCN